MAMSTEQLTLLGEEEQLVMTLSLLGSDLFRAIPADLKDPTPTL